MLLSPNNRRLRARRHNVCVVACHHHGLELCRGVAESKALELHMWLCVWKEARNDRIVVLILMLKKPEHCGGT